ncbi:MAG: amidohydrolase family protein [Opitutales bacterium]
MRRRVFLSVLWTTAGLLGLPLVCQAESLLLVKGGTILTMEPGEILPFEGWFTVDADGRIDEIGEGAPPADIEASDTVDATGKIILPGFISAHSHLWSAPFRGIASEDNLYAWIAAAHTPFGDYFKGDDFHVLTMYGALDFTSHGITTAYNWVANYGWDYDEWMGHFTGSLACEQRIIFGWAVDIEQSEAVNRERLAAFIDEAEGLKKDHPNLLDISLSALGMLRGDTEFPWMEGRLMEEFGIDAQTHYLEAPEIKHVQHQQFKILEDSGMLCDQLHFAHFIHTTEDILHKTVEAGTRMCWNPLSNGRLGSGLADIPKYRRAGMRIGMGLDGQASGDHSDPFENMRMGLYATRMKYESAAIMTPYQVLALHTIDSAEMLNVDAHVGSLEPGKFADFLIMNPLEPDAGPIIDVYATVVMVLSTRNLERVYIGGEKVYANGIFTNHDWPAIRDDSHARVERMIREIEADGGEVPVPSYLNHFYQP